MLVPRDAPLPPDVAASLRQVPMPPTDLPEGALSHEAFWAMPADQRANRKLGRAFRGTRRLRSSPAPALLLDDDAGFLACTRLHARDAGIRASLGVDS